MRHTYPIQVRFSETDALGHVNNTSYFIYFETARTELFRVFVPDLNTKQWALILANTSCDFRAEAHFGQELLVSTFVTKIGNSSFSVGHEIHDEKSGALIAQGTAVMVHYDFIAKKAVPISDEQRVQLEDWME